MPSYAIEPFIIRYHFSLSTPCHKQNRIGFCYAFLCYRAILKQVSLSLFWYAVTSKAAFIWGNIWLIVSKHKVPIIDLNVGSGGKKIQNHSYKYLDKHLFFPFLSLNFSCFLQMLLSPSEFTQRGGGGAEMLCPVASLCSVPHGFFLLADASQISDTPCVTVSATLVCAPGQVTHGLQVLQGCTYPILAWKPLQKHIFHIAWAGHHLLFWLGIL